MIKLKNYALLGFMGLMGTLTIGATSAETTVTHYPDSNIQYILNGSELFTGVGTITITNGDDTITILDRNLGSVSSSNECLLDFSNICSPGYEAFGFPSEDECILYYGSRNFNTSICTQNLSGYADADACVNAIYSSYGSVVSAQQHCESFSYGYYFQ